MFEPITDEEMSTFDTLVECAAGRFANAQIALMRVQFDGEDAAAIIIVSQAPDSEEVFNTPVGLLVGDALFERLTPPPDQKEA